MTVLATASTATIWRMSIVSRPRPTAIHGFVALPLASLPMNFVTSDNRIFVAPAATVAISLGSLTEYGRTECS